MKGAILNRSLLHNARLHSANERGHLKQDSVTHWKSTSQCKCFFLLILDIMDYVFFGVKMVCSSLKYESTCSSFQVFLENELTVKLDGTV